VLDLGEVGEFDGIYDGRLGRGVGVVRGRGGGGVGGVLVIEAGVHLQHW